jgi:DNA-directed RNA polymerase subunit F
VNKEYLRKLVHEASEIDPQNDVLMELNRQKRFAEMSKSVNETITYLNKCSEMELLLATEVLEDLSKHFKSKELIQCIERNAQRCFEKETKKQLDMTLEYMYKYI